MWRFKPPRALSSTREFMRLSLFLAYLNLIMSQGNWSSLSQLDAPFSSQWSSSALRDTCGDVSQHSWRFLGVTVPTCFSGLFSLLSFDGHKVSWPGLVWASPQGGIQTLSCLHHLLHILPAKAAVAWRCPLPGSVCVPGSSWPSLRIFSKTSSTMVGISHLRDKKTKVSKKQATSDHHRVAEPRTRR